MRFLSGLVYAVFLLLVLTAGSLAGWLGKSKVLGNGFVHIFEKPQDTFKQDTLTLLVLGCDEDRATGGKRVLKSGVRSDMMLLAKIDFVKKKITGLSIPRDTIVKVGRYRLQKINAYHAIGGGPLAKEAVETLLPGVTIDRVVELDYKAFQDLVELVGGVPIVVEKNLKYTDRAGGLYINLKKGYQKLNGYNAMCYVRYRHGDSDFARQDRQHHFLLAFKDVIEQKKQMLPQVADQAVKVMGGAFSDVEAFKLAQFAKDLKESDIKLGSVPVLDKPQPNPHYEEILDEDKVEDTLREYNLLAPEARTANAKE